MRRTRRFAASSQTAKQRRHEALLEIIDREKIRTQARLAELLETAGFPCTQASISRDIKELKLVKQGGVYIVPSDAGAAAPKTDELGSSVAPFIRSATMAGENIVVVHTVTGTANSVGLYIDKAGWPGMLGTVAGDDTILVAVSDGQAARQLVKRVLAIGRSSPGRADMTGPAWLE